MPRIRLILEDDQGDPICAEAQRVYELEGSLQTLDEIEEATETFKQQALPEIEHSLLSQAQERFVARGKKQDLPLHRNGKEYLQLQTLHGSFAFACQRLSAAGRSAGHYLDHSGQGTVSRGLREFCLYFSGRLSFAEVAKLLKRLTGQRLVCEQTLCNWVGQQAQHIEQSLETEVEALRSSTGELPAPEIAEQVEIYDREAREVLVMSDAIGVKAQRPTRERRTEEPRPEKKLKHISTDLMMIEGRDGSFHHLCAGLDETPTLSELAKAHLRKEWGSCPEPLPIVAITDGARSIRLMLEGLFGPRLTVILDWYHLCKKAYELLSMVAHGRAEREQLQKQLLGSLWHGRVSEAVSMLRGVEARKAEALQSLVTYLEKHAQEIIDYERRAKAGKAIGSGRMEKAVDQAVGLRQKKKGMSWSKSGSRSLAMLKVAELNDHWDELWDEVPTAA